VKNRKTQFIAGITIAIFIAGASVLGRPFHVPGEVLLTTIDYRLTAALRGRAFRERRSLFVVPREERVALAKKLTGMLSVKHDLKGGLRGLDVTDRLAQDYLIFGIPGDDIEDMIERFNRTENGIDELELFLQREILTYYVDNSVKLQRSIISDTAYEAEEVHELFEAGIRVYKFDLTRDEITKRKCIIRDLLLSNMKPEYFERGKRVLGSPIRSIEAKALMISEIFASQDPQIYGPALAAVIEILSYAEKRHSDFFNLSFYPMLRELLKGQKRRAHFAEEFVLTFVQAEAEGVNFILGELRLEEFLAEARTVMLDLAGESPVFRSELIYNFRLWVMPGEYIFSLSEIVLENLIALKPGRIYYEQI